MAPLWGTFAKSLSWLTFLGHMKDSLWSMDLFRCESATLRSHWVLVVMDQYTRRIIGFGVHAGTILISGTDTAPGIWSDNKDLREAQPADRMGTMLVYRGTYCLPNIRAGALFDRARTLFEKSKPDLEKIEPLLKEGLALRSNDFSGWMMVGNLHLLRGEREKALAAYEKARDSTPPSPFRTLFEEQAQRVATQPFSSVKPMRDPSIE